jgi:hypothetical protein
MTTNSLAEPPTSPSTVTTPVLLTVTSFVPMTR